MKLNLKLIKLVLAIALSSASLLGSLSLVVAESSRSTPTKLSQPTNSSPGKGIVFNAPPPPPGPPPAGRRYGGARRNQCPVVEPPLTALVPSTGQPPSVTNVWGITTQGHPKLWFYSPYTKSSGYPVEFVLLDEESKDSVYKSAIALPEKAGVISVPLPTSATPLQTGKQYRWFLNVYCDPQKQSAPVYVEGVILRQNLSQAVAKELQKAQPQQQVSIYAKNGFWHDALTTLAQLRQKNPQNPALQKEWKELLGAIGLGEVGAKPIISK